MLRLNEQLLDAINGLAHRSALADALGRFAASDLLYLIAAVVAVLGAREFLRDRRAAVRLGVAGVVAVVASLLVAQVFGHLWFEPRPFVNDADTILLIPHSADAAFPSDHLAVAAAAAGVAGLAWRRAIPWLAVMVALLAVGRVFVGVHYPGDVLTGSLIGIVCAVVAWRLLCNDYWQARSAEPA